MPAARTPGPCHRPCVPPCSPAPASRPAPPRQRPEQRPHPSSTIHALFNPPEPAAQPCGHLTITPEVPHSFTLCPFLRPLPFPSTSPLSFDLSPFLRTSPL